MTWFDVISAVIVGLIMSFGYGPVVGIFSLSAAVITLTLMNISDSLRKISEKGR